MDAKQTQKQIIQVVSRTQQETDHLCTHMLRLEHAGSKIRKQFMKEKLENARLRKSLQDTVAAFGRLKVCSYVLY